MQRLWPRRTDALPATLRFTTMPAVVLPVWAALALLAGCASPGPPRPPSLQLPRLVSDLTATRSGDAVTLQFTVSSSTTDGQPLRAQTIAGRLCRQLAGDARCLPVDGGETQTPLNVPSGTPPEPVVWTDRLPPALATGSPRAIAYRVELKNTMGRSAGLSDPVYAVAGAAPPAVTGLTAGGTRLGIQLTWQAAAGAGEILLERTEPVPATPLPGQPPRQGAHARAGKPLRPAAVTSGHKRESTPGVVWLQAAPGDPSAGITMDAGITEGTPYRYLAVRRQVVQIGGRTLELRSEPSATVALAWHDIYPPPTPTGLTALGYFAPIAGENAAVPGNPAAPEAPSVPERKGPFAVDLIWQPVRDTRLAGYLVYRQPLTTAGEPAGKREKLTPEPIVAPGFHDATASPAVRYRYFVTAIDPKGNESAATTTIAEPLTTP